MSRGRGGCKEYLGLLGLRVKWSSRISAMGGGTGSAKDTGVLFT